MSVTAHSTNQKFEIYILNIYICWGKYLTFYTYGRDFIY